MEAARFKALIERARALYAHSLRLTPWRAFLIAGLDGRGAEALVDSMADLGFVIDAADPRLRIAACPGAPACMHGHRRVRDDATRWAAMLPKGDGVILHVSGCAKGCARPAATAATFTATATGYDLILGGRAGDPPARRGLSSAEVAAASRRRRREHVCWREADVKPNYAYEKDAAAIYRRSFAIIRGEADLARFSPIEERVAVRVIHACGMVEAARDLVFSPGAAEAARDALRAGAPIFCDARMVAEGVTRARLPANNDVDLHALPTHPRPNSQPSLARRARRRRLSSGCRASAAPWSPSAMRRPLLFRLLEAISAGAPRPAAIIGMPVGFVGAAELKEALIESGLPAIVVRGRKGGSAMAAAAVNALASDIE